MAKMGQGCSMSQEVIERLKKVQSNADKPWLPKHEWNCVSCPGNSRSLQLKVKVMQVVPFLSTVMLPTGLLPYQISAVHGHVAECHLSTYFYHKPLNKKNLALVYVKDPTTLKQISMSFFECPAFWYLLQYKTITCPDTYTDYLHYSFLRPQAGFQYRWKLLLIFWQNWGEGQCPCYRKHSAIYQTYFSALLSMLYCWDGKDSRRVTAWKLTAAMWNFYK